MYFIVNTRANASKVLIYQSLLTPTTQCQLTQAAITIELTHVITNNTIKTYN